MIYKIGTFKYWKWSWIKYADWDLKLVQKLFVVIEIHCIVLEKSSEHTVVLTWPFSCACVACKESTTNQCHCKIDARRLNHDKIKSTSYLSKNNNLFLAQQIAAKTQLMKGKKIRLHIKITLHELGFYGGLPLLQYTVNEVKVASVTVNKSVFLYWNSCRAFQLQITWSVSSQKLRLTCNVL